MKRKIRIRGLARWTEIMNSKRAEINFTRRDKGRIFEHVARIDGQIAGKYESHAFYPEASAGWIYA